MLWMDDVEDVVDARYSLFNELNAELVHPPAHQCRPPTSVRPQQLTWCRLGLRR